MLKFTYRRTDKKIYEKSDGTNLKYFFPIHHWMKIKSERDHPLKILGEKNIAQIKIAYIYYSNSLVDPGGIIAQ